jgi:ferritin-like metal-binding protein YciE
MAMTLDSHEKLFIHELKDLYNAENQLIKTLPKVAKAVNSSEVKTAINKHLAETKEQAKRLERILKEMDYGASGVKCLGMEGLVSEADEIIKEKELPKDLLTETLVSGGQKIEHYEIVAYQSAAKAARELGKGHAADLLEQSLAEEQKALLTLEELAAQI